jgi:hypothetical protein
MTKMTEDDLLRFLEEEADRAHHDANSEIVSDRVDASKSYMRQPYGTEEDGRSQVVASDVFDAVEGVLPDLIEVFTSSDKAVVFEPVGPEDEDGAEQATNACNYVFYKQNNGFLILYTAIKDALLLKTGGVKWCWEKKRTPSFTTYRGDEIQIAAHLVANPKAQVVEQEQLDPTQEEIQQYQQAQQMAAQAGMEIPPMPVRYMVKIKTVEEKGRVRVDAIPPDELRVSARHNSLLLDECPYVAHVVEKSMSDVKQMGYKITVDEIKATQDERQSADRDYLNRRTFTFRQDDNEQDESRIKGWLREEYVLVDFDGDGIAERRRILRFGDKILENSECSHVPIAAWTPYILTHQFAGQSIADLVVDFQKIHTEIWRQQLDNLYLANNQESVVQTDSQGSPLANIDDLLNRRPGGIIREKVAGAVRPYSERWQGIEAMPMLEQLNVAKENRTGYTRYSQGLDSNSLNKTATGVSMIMNASQKRQKLMARIVAEALVAPMFRGIFKTLSDYGMEAISYRLNGKFVRYDPQEWRDGYDMSINVGIGTGDKIQQSGFLQQMAQAQAAVAQSPMARKLLTPKNVFNLQARLAENAGFKNPEEFWTDPDSEEVKAQDQQPPPPDPRMMLEQAKLQNDQHKTQAQMQLDTQKTQAQMVADQQKFQAELAFKAEQAQLDRNQELMLEEMRLQYGAMQAPQAPVEPVEPVEQEDGTNDAISMLADSMLAPKQVIRDENGMVVGVQSTRSYARPQDELMAQVSQSLAMLAQAINAPKQVIRDNEGRAVGVAPVN